VARVVSGDKRPGHCPSGSRWSKELAVTLLAGKHKKRRGLGLDLAYDTQDLVLAQS